MYAESMHTQLELKALQSETILVLIALEAYQDEFCLSHSVHYVLTFPAEAHSFMLLRFSL